MAVMRTPARSLVGLSAAPVALLAACGYTPLYAPGEGAAQASAYVQVGQVQMDLPERNVGQRRVAQTVAQQLKLDFPASGPEMDTAAVGIKETIGTLAVQRSAAIQRAQINLEGTLTLTNPNGDTLLRTVLSTNAPYNVENTPYSTESGKTYARTTAARNLADEISRRLYLYYRTHEKGFVPEQPAGNSVQAPAGRVITSTIPLPFGK